MKLLQDPCSVVCSSSPMHCCFCFCTYLGISSDAYPVLSAESAGCNSELLVSEGDGVGLKKKRLGESRPVGGANNCRRFSISSWWSSNSSNSSWEDRTINKKQFFPSPQTTPKEGAQLCTQVECQGQNTRRKQKKRWQSYKSQMCPLFFFNCSIQLIK